MKIIKLKCYNEIYIPANCAQDVGLYSYMPGIGGSGDAWALRNEIYGDNPPQYIVCIAANCNSNDLLPDSVNMLEQNGYNVNNVYASGFSASGGNVYDSVNTLLTEHPEINATISVINSTNDSEVVKHPEDYQALIEHGVPILCVDPADSANRLYYMETGLNNGFNMYYWEASSWGHDWFNNDFLSNRVADCILGYADDYGSVSANTGAIVYNLFIDI